MVDGDALGTKDREGIAEAGGLFEVALREGDVLPRGQRCDKGTVAPDDGHVTLPRANVTLPGVGQGDVEGHQTMQECVANCPALTQTRVTLPSVDMAGSGATTGSMPRQRAAECPLGREWGDR